VAAWRADTIAYETAPYTMRSDFRQLHDVPVEAALWAAVPRAAAWLRGRDDLPVPPGTIGGADAIHRLADLVTVGLEAPMRDHLAHFAIRVGARRLADAATALADLGDDRAAAVATRQARLLGGLQHDIVAGSPKSAAETLRQLAPTYEEFATSLTSVY
jgi:hypothetical protein